MMNDDVCHLSSVAMSLLVTWHLGFMSLWERGAGVMLLTSVSAGAAGGCLLPIAV